MIESATHVKGSPSAPQVDSLLVTGHDAYFNHADGGGDLASDHHHPHDATRGTRNPTNSITLNHKHMPKKAITAAIILALLTSSCATLEKHSGLIGGIAAVGVTAGSFLLMKKRKEDKEEKRVSTPTAYDPTGSALEFGGALVAPDTLVHVIHWGSYVGQRLSFPSKSGGNDGRAIASFEDIAHDVRVIKLDKPLDPKEHKIWKIAPAEEGAVTIARFKRETFGTNIVDINSGWLTGAAKAGELKSGDSGKVWSQIQDGKAVLVGVSSRGGYGVAPNLWSKRERIFGE